MPLKIIVEFDDDRAGALLARMRSRLGETEALHDAMAEAVEQTVRTHIRTTKKSPHSDWWGRAAASVTHESSGDSATVSVTQRGAALRYYGGRVNRKPGGPYLALPMFRTLGKTQMAPREAGLLAFLPSKKKGTRGVLVEGMKHTVTRGKNKGKQVTRPLPGGSLLYVLREYTDHKPDPTVLPTGQQLAESARDAALDYVAADLS